MMPEWVWDMAIKALEQKPILDKIRAEITKYEGDCRLSVDEYPSCKQCTDNVFETIYGIIDKYKAESEEISSLSNIDGTFIISAEKPVESEET